MYVGVNVIRFCNCLFCYYLYEHNGLIEGEERGTNEIGVAVHWMFGCVNGSTSWIVKDITLQCLRFATTIAAV